MRMVSYRRREPVIKPEALRIQVMRIRAKPWRVLTKERESILRPSFAFRRSGSQRWGP